MTAPRPLSAEIVAAVRRWQAALHAEYSLADTRPPTADEYYKAGKACADARAGLEALLLSDPVPKPTSSENFDKAFQSAIKSAYPAPKPARRRGR